MNAGAGDRPAEGNPVRSRAIGLGDPVGAAEHHALHRSIAVEQRDGRVGTQEPEHMRRAEPFTTGHHLTEPGERSEVFIDDHVEQAAGQPHGIDARLGDVGPERGGGQVPLCRDDGCPAGQQHRPKFEREHVPRHRRGEGHCAAGAKTRKAVALEQARGRAMRSEHRLGSAGRARGEEDSAGIGVLHTSRPEASRRFGRTRGDGPQPDRGSGSRLCDQHGAVQSRGRLRHAAIWPGRVEQGVGSSGLEHGDQRDDQLVAARQHDRHLVAGSHTVLDEVGRPCVRGAIELAVGQAAACRADGHRIRP